MCLNGWFGCRIFPGNEPSKTFKVNIKLGKLHCFLFKGKCYGAKSFFQGAFFYGSVAPSMDP